MSICVGAVFRCTRMLFEVFGGGTRLFQFVLKIQYFSISPAEYHQDHRWKNGERSEIMLPERVFSASWNCSKCLGNTRNKNSHILFEASLPWAYKLVINFAVEWCAFYAGNRIGFGCEYKYPVSILNKVTKESDSISSAECTSIRMCKGTDAII